MQVIPIEKEIPNQQQALPYEQVSNIIENSQSFAVFDCICKKEKHLLNEAISMIRKLPEEIVPSPKDEMEWYEKRAIERGVDISRFK